MRARRSAESVCRSLDHSDLCVREIRRYAKCAAGPALAWATVAGEDAIRITFNSDLKLAAGTHRCPLHPLRSRWWAPVQTVSGFERSKGFLRERHCSASLRAIKRIGGGYSKTSMAYRPT